LNARLTMLLAGAALLTFVVAGCGGDSGSDEVTTITTSSLSKAEFVKEANDFCFRQQANNLKRIVKYAQDYRAEGRPPQELFANAMKSIVLPEVEANIANFRELGAPAGDESLIEEMVEALQEGVESVESARRISERQAYEDHFKRANKLVRDYGLPSCANA